MSTEQTESTPQPGPVPPAEGPPPAEWGAPPPPSAAPKSRWTAKRTIIAIVVAVGIAAAGGVAIYVASGSVDNNAGGPGGGRVGGPMMVGGPMGGMEGTEHGEFQIGDITALTDDSITVKSEDGYEQTYAMTSDTRKTDNLAKGHRVTVVATTENGKATAQSVLELGAMNGPGGNRGNGRQGGDFTPPGS